MLRSEGIMVSEDGGVDMSRYGQRLFPVDVSAP
jgi:hypothetical protein